MSHKSKLLNQKHNEKSDWNNINTRFLNTSHCKSKKNTENVNSKVIETKHGKAMLLSKQTVCNSKNSRFIKEQESKVLLSSLSLKTSLNKLLLLADILL